MGILLLLASISILFSSINIRVNLPVNSKVILVSKEKGLLRFIERKGRSYKITSEIFISYGQTKGSKFKAGDRKTPLGVYFPTRVIAREDLPHKRYGAGAIPLNYPNPVDKILSKTGDGIWIHGTDEIDRLTDKKSTDGCIILKNSDLIKIMEKIRPHRTPVIISNNFKEINLSSKNTKGIIIRVQDEKVEYKVTTGLGKPNILYESIKVYNAKQKSR